MCCVWNSCMILSQTMKKDYILCLGFLSSWNLKSQPVARDKSSMLIMLLFNIQSFLNAASSFKLHQFSHSAIYRLASTKRVAENQVLLLLFSPAVVQLFLVPSFIHHYDCEGKGTDSVARLDCVYTFYQLLRNQHFLSSLEISHWVIPGKFILVEKLFNRLMLDELVYHDSGEQTETLTMAQKSKNNSIDLVSLLLSAISGNMAVPQQLLSFS